MKLHYAGKYDGKEESLPRGEHQPGAVAFREPSAEKLSLIANLGSLPLFALTFLCLILRGGLELAASWKMMVGFVLAMAALVPHEILHALCFRGDVYFYQALSRGMLFVVGPETMSKGRFVLMSLLPNLVFGLLPLALYLIFPKLVILGAMGALALPMGFGDYMNVFNALTQMPRGARTYLYGFHSYWYQP